MIEVSDIPSSWDGVTVTQFVELSSLSGDDPLDSMVDIVAILTDSDTETVRQMPVTAIQPIYERLLFSQTPPAGHDTEIEIDGAAYRLVDFPQIIVGQWIDLEHAIEGGTMRNLHLILSILYGRDTSYTVGQQAEATKFLSVPISRVHGALIAFLEYRQKLYKSYESMMAEPLVKDRSKLSKKELAELELEERKQKKWNWLSFLHRAAGGDLLKYDAAARLNFVFVMNVFLMEHERNA